MLCGLAWIICSAACCLCVVGLNAHNPIIVTIGHLDYACLHTAMHAVCISRKHLRNGTHHLCLQVWQWTAVAKCAAVADHPLLTGQQGTQSLCCCCCMSPAQLACFIHFMLDPNVF